MKKQLVLGLVLLVSAGLGLARAGASDPKVIERAILYNWETIGDQGRVAGGSCLLAVEIGLKEKTTEQTDQIKQPKPVQVTARNDGKYDIEIALYDKKDSFDGNDLDTGCFAAAYAYGFAGFYLEALGLKGDTFWGTPGTNAMYKTFYEDSGENAKMIPVSKAISPKLVGDLTFTFYDLDITDTTYDSLGKLANKGGIKVQYLGKIVLRHSNASKINWTHWDEVETNGLAGLCEFYGSDNHLVQQTSQGVGTNGSEISRPSN